MRCMSKSTEKKRMRLVQYRSDGKYVTASNWYDSADSLAKALPDVIKRFAFGGTFRYADGTIGRIRPAYMFAFEFESEDSRSLGI